MSKTITLTRVETCQAIMVGALRQLLAVETRNARPAHGLAADDDETWNAWDRHIRGACGEFAVAKLLDLPWTGFGFDRAVCDVGDAYEVRTCSPGRNELVVRPKDPERAIYILAIGSPPTFEIVGFIPGRDAKQRRYEQDRNRRNAPAYFIPRRDLHAIDALIRSPAVARNTRSPSGPPTDGDLLDCLAVDVEG